MRTDVKGEIRFRVSFSDVDAVQFFFADYYRWMERAWAELMDACEYPRAESLGEGVGFPVVESGCKYLARAVLDDQLVVTAAFESMSARSFRVAYDFVNADGIHVAQGFTHHVCVDVPTMTARPVPAQYRGARPVEGDA